MAIDPRYASLRNKAGTDFQVLRPVQYAERKEIDLEGKVVVTKYELPREWDEAATYKAMTDAR